MMPSLREGTIGGQDGNRMPPNVAGTSYALYISTCMYNIEERMVEGGGG